MGTFNFVLQIVGAAILTFWAAAWEFHADLTGKTRDAEPLATTLACGPAGLLTGCSPPLRAAGEVERPGRAGAADQAARFRAIESYRNITPTETFTETRPR